jgi:hypothetical protein
MPLDLQAILARRYVVPFVYLEQPVRIVIQPERVTDGWRERLRLLYAAFTAEERKPESERRGIDTPLDADEQQALRAQQAALIADVLVEWDVVDGGAPLPTDAPRLLALGDDFCTALLASIVEAISSGKASGARPLTMPSVSGSKPTVRLVNSPKASSTKRSRTG